MSKSNTAEEDIVVFEHDDLRSSQIKINGDNTVGEDGQKTDETGSIVTIDAENIGAAQTQQQPKKEPKKMICTQVHHSFGFQSLRRNNVQFISTRLVVLAVGNTIHFYDLKYQTYQFIEAQGTEGIGAIVVHPTMKYLAVGEKGDMPNVYIYEVEIETETYVENGREYQNVNPKIKLYKTLTKGTSKAYSAMNFNKDGTKLATVGSYPDFMMTIWDWESESIILRYKAFGTEVYNVTFSPNSDGQLTTSGTGHIKFWKMAETFTGLKLQGQIGKFGKIDISDVAGYVELPDGKVLSGSEQGNLLLWDGNLIKSIVMRSDGTPCHQGMIEVVIHETRTSMFITAGADGYMRYWDFETIDTKESDSDGMLYVDPIVEIPIGQNVNIIALSRPAEGNFWIIQDANGAIWRVTDYRAIEKDISEKSFIHKLYEFHAGTITGAATSPFDHFVVTCGMDGTVRLFDYFKKMSIYYCQFSSGATCMAWNPKIVDPDQHTLTVGFNDGVFRVIRRCEDNFELVKASKPHTMPITDFSYSRDGQIFVTASTDCTMFFFEAKQRYRPIGFIKFDSVPTSMAWNVNNEVLLVGFKNGKVIELNVDKKTVLDKIDSDDTYEFTASYKVFMFHNILKPDTKKNEKDEPIVDFEALARDKPCKIEKIQYSRDDTSLLISFSKSDNTPCMFEYYSIATSWVDSQALENSNKEMAEWPKRAVSIRKCPCTSMNYSNSGAYMVLGFENGKISLIDQNHETRDSERELETHALHDGFEGRISQACLSFDDSFLVSVGVDGCFFVQKVLGKETEMVDKVVFKTVDSDETDITETSFFSIQQARLQHEEEKKISDAQSRKDLRLQEIEKIRERFKAMAAINDKKDPTIRLSRDELQIDLQFQENMMIKLNERLQISKRETEWNSIKINLRLKKLKEHFIDPLHVERIELTAFDSDKKVCSFKTMVINPLLRQHIDAVHAIINEEINKRNRYGMNSNDQNSNSPGDVNSPADTSRDLTASFRSGVHNGSFIDKHSGAGTRRFRHVSAIEKAEDLKRQREQRHKMRHDLMQKQPSDNEEDQEVMQEILYCQQNMGDFKLKTDVDYMVPEQQRVTAEKKLRQMILLEESMHTLRMVFNVRLLGLRDLKSRLIQKFSKYNESIAQINKKLGIKEKLREFSTQSITEYPENREKVTSQQLASFEKEVAAEQRRLDRIEKQKAGMGTNLQDDDDEEDADERKSTGAHSGKSKKSSVKAQSVIGRDLTAKERDDMERESRIASIQLSDMEIAERQIEQEKQNYEKTRLLRKQEKQISSFDLAVEELRRERFKLASDLKNADIKLLLLYQEYEILKDFEIKDNSSFNEFQQKKQAKATVVQKIEQCHDKLAQKKTEIGQLVKQEQLMQEFQNLVPTNHPTYAELLKLFKKGSQNDEQNDSDDDDNDSDDSDMSDDENAAPNNTSDAKGDAVDRSTHVNRDDDVKPPDQCDPKLFEQVMHLRRRRIDQEKLLDSIVKSVEVLKKEREALQKKEAIMNSELKKIETTIINTQRDKQNKLNELQTIVVLKLSQIQSLMQRKIPQDLSEHVVFTNRGLETLADRIRELKDERKQLRKRHHDLQKEHRQLVKEQKQKELEYQTWKDKVREVQLLKFGRVINLEELEKATVDMESEELKQILQQSEDDSHKELARWDQRLNEYKERLTKITNENTDLLKQLATLRREQQTLENELDASQKTMVTRMIKSMKEDVVDSKIGLKNVIAVQQQEIEAYRNEIRLLCHKTSL
ncbi:flagella-associated protein 44 [Acrasis kona]|uniref:Flagella-associated protein 44 n=1 Tax=Acrasis kona TaxID=1008807 RepID=A0AAW2YWT7_9EUKA